MFRSRSALLLLLLPLGLQAQLGNKLRSLVIEDTLAPPDHDTAYIKEYRQELTLSVISNARLATLEIGDSSGHHADFYTNSATQYGLSLTYKWLTLEGTVSIPALNTPDPKLGTTRSQSLGFGATGRRLWIRSFWNLTTGFRPEPPQAIVAGWQAGDAWPLRPDLRSETVMASVNWATSKKRRFSQNAALWQMERQQRSAGTWVLGGALWYSDVRADSSLVPFRDSLAFDSASCIDRAQRFLLGPTFGYTHTFVFWHRGFIHAALLTGAAYRSQKLRQAETGSWKTYTGASSLTEAKLGVGYNGNRWYTAITMAFYINSDSEEEKVQLGGMFGNVRFALGFRFGAPNIKGMDRLGF
jgi:hypothetical protein